MLAIVALAVAVPRAERDLLFASGYELTCSNNGIHHALCGVNGWFTEVCAKTCDACKEGAVCEVKTWPAHWPVAASEACSVLHKCGCCAGVVFVPYEGDDRRRLNDEEITCDPPYEGEYTMPPYATEVEKQIVQQIKDMKWPLMDLSDGEGNSRPGGSSCEWAESKCPEWHDGCVQA